MNKFTRLGAVTLLLFAIWGTQAHAGFKRWTVEDTWVAITKPMGTVTRTLSTTTETESATEDYVDDAGNTVRKTTTYTYNVSNIAIDHKVQKATFFRLEKTTRKGKLLVKTHSSRTWLEVDRTETQSTRTLANTDISEAIIAYAPTPDPEPVAEEEITPVEEVAVVEEEITPVAVEEVVSPTIGALDFGDNSLYLGTKTTMVSDDASYYRALPEIRLGNTAVKQDAALARGWTGKGSTIGILDSGIDLDHSEFNSTGKIVYQQDRTGTGIQDNIGHGSHVASIAAGEMDGTGMMGIAPDANLAIFKITNSWSVSTTNAKRAMRQARDEGVDITVYNFSGNVNYSEDYNAAMTYQGNGIYTNNHHYYGGSNYYNMETPNGWANALSGTESVLVVSAGNQSIGYTQSPAVFATATDSAGNLLLDGRMIIAGNWNISTQTVEGGNAGHVCKNWTGSTCADTYRTSDFYLLAPGMMVEGANHDGTYREMSGSSQAAPVISGAVAVLHQMWPYMKGKDLAQVLLKTGNKELPNYDVNVHGQGLLDLDAATRPLGDIGVSYTGRTGTTVPISGGLSIAGGDASGALSSISVVDSIGRDYKVDVSNFSQTRDLIPVYQLDHTAGKSWSSKFVGGAMEHKGMHFNAYQSDSYNMDSETYDNITLGFDSTMFNTRNPHTGEILNPSALTEKFTMTRSQYSPFVAFNGMFGSVQGTTTFEYSTLFKPIKQNWYGQAGVMYSMTEFKQGLVEDVTPITSLYAVAGWADDNLNLYTGIKPTVVDGSLKLNLPTSVDANGNMNYTNHEIGLDNDPVAYIGAQFKTDDIVTPRGETHSLKMNGVVDQNNQYKVGAFYEFTF